MQKTVKRGRLFNKGFITHCIHTVHLILILQWLALVWHNGKCLPTACSACFYDISSRYLSNYVCDFARGLSEGITCCMLLQVILIPSVTTIRPLKQQFYSIWHCFINMCDISLKKGAPKVNLIPRILFRKKTAKQSNSELNLNTGSVMECFFSQKNFRLRFSSFLEAEPYYSHTCNCVFSPNNTLSDTKIYNPHQIVTCM